ncbi:PREDICTED: sesquipedalian-1 [Mandrillus leucophaeus]|uniref:sesquipedalian-1 n=1 Tax=Mandrillus leucophaeus TaxID=9568 RepID=UPI0005F471EF|nr:PREDICTED: sesquipedalian-1 [Mandrillus leucophaeus]
MKLNERSLAFYATCDAPVDNAGFLYKKGGRHAAYHRRWFVLRGNMLFYFEDAASREPVGVIILEGCTVELVEAAEEFAFAVRFAGTRARTYVLAAESQAAMEGWVKALSPPELSPHPHTPGGDQVLPGFGADRRSPFFSPQCPFFIQGEPRGWEYPLALTLGHVYSPQCPTPGAA